ncbi:MAG: hypothetical protein HGA65_09985 [Oscillochloris sp.]|nr:hypothetical protein [Oscillochloris sp.]
MTTALPPPQIVINARPYRLQPYLEMLHSYGQTNAEDLARTAQERQRLERQQRILSTTGIISIILGLFVAVTFHPILFLIVGAGIGLLVWTARGPGQRLRAMEENPIPDVTGRCMLASWLLTNLQPDLRAGQRLSGQIDLSGIEQGGTVGRTMPTAWKATVSYIYQRWLDLDLILLDGNELRLRATERLKLRPGHYRKGSVSGKSKWKPAKRSMRQRVAVRLRLNPAVYDRAASQLPLAARQIGALNVIWTDRQGDDLRVLAEVENDRLAPEELLQLLREIYARLVRRPVA